MPENLRGFLGGKKLYVILQYTHNNKLNNQREIRSLS